MIKKIVMIIVVLGCVICLGVDDYLHAEMDKQNFKVVDGDSLEQGDERIRILNIDAPEYKQYCHNADGERYLCGKKALEHLRQFVSKGITCRRIDKDRYGRSLAECFMDDGTDVGRQMVVDGWAVAYGDAYVNEEIVARKNKRGIWQGKFMRPELFRALKRSREHSRNKKI